MKRTYVAILIAGVVIPLMAAPQKNTSAAAQMQAAINKQTVEGDLNGAIKQYAALVAKYAKSDRATAAQALVRIGACYEALGDAEARKAYERVTKEFGDQKDAVAEARKRLTAKGSTSETGIIARQIAATGDRRYGRGISPDGRHLVFTNQGNIIGVHDLSTGEVRTVITRPSPDSRVSNAVLSPDGKHIAYQRRERDASELYIAGADGSNPHPITDKKVISAMPIEWSPNGRQLLVSSSDAGPKVELLSIVDGSSRVIASNARSGSISPDGRFIAIVKAKPGGGFGDIALVRSDGGREISLADGRYGEPLWTPDGKRVLVLTQRDGRSQLWSIPVSDGAAAGSPEFVRDAVGSLVAATRDGEYYFQSYGRERDVYAADFNPQSAKLTSRPKQLTAQNLNFGGAWSPDGQYLAYFSMRGPQSATRPTIVIRAAKSGEERELPLNEWVPSYMPQWFPDSRSLFVHTGRGKLHRLDTQTGETRPLLEQVTIAPYADGAAFQFYRNYVLLAPDGRSLYYLVRDRDAKQARVFRRGLDGGPEAEVCRITSNGIVGFSISSDGSRLAFTISDPFAAPGPRGSVLTVPAGGGEPKEVYRSADHWLHDSIWTKDGRQLLVMVDYGQGAKDIWLVPSEGGEAKPLGIGLHMKYFLSLHPSGNQIVFSNEQGHNYLSVLKNLFPRVDTKR